jgi:hypothetical protein
MSHPSRLADVARRRKGSTLPGGAAIRVGPPDARCTVVSLATTLCSSVLLRGEHKHSGCGTATSILSLRSTMPLNKTRTMTDEPQSGKHSEERSPLSIESVRIWAFGNRRYVTEFFRR